MKKIIYQVLLRLWGHGKFSDWDNKCFEYLHSLGVDYVWYTGIPRHATGKPFVKGDPGSMYSVSDWMDVNPYLAVNEDDRMEEFSSLVKRTHDAGFGVLMDYIPNHVSRDYSGKIAHFDYCDGDWTDTYKNDWSAPQTREAMLEILLFWASNGVDGFRCDMVELVPQDALKSLIAAVKEKYPDMLFVAEVYDKANYGPCLDYEGFDLIYDKSGMYDILRAISCYGASARGLTANWQFLGAHQPRMLNFLENHDEQRVASPQFMCSAQTSYAALAAALLFNEASFMLYFGQEVGESASESSNGRTSIFNWSDPQAVNHLQCYIHLDMGLDEVEASVLSRYRELLGYAKIPAFAEGKCWDLCYCNLQTPKFDADRHFVFMRFNAEEFWLVFCNFSDSAVLVNVELPPEMQSLCGRKTISVYTPAKDASVTML